MKVRTTWMIVAVMVSLPGFGLEAQQRPRRGGAGPGEVDRAVARALRMGDEIDLTDAQREQLRGVQAEALQALETLEREQLELRQELRASQRQAAADPATTREDLRTLRGQARADREAFRDRARELAAPLRERYEGILDAEQRLELRERGRAGRARFRSRRTSPSRRGCTPHSTRPMHQHPNPVRCLNAGSRPRR